MRNWMAGFSAVLAALMLAAAPEEAWADKTVESAGRCAVRYLQVNLSRQAPKLIAELARIKRQDRGWKLIHTYKLAPAAPAGSSFLEDLNKFVRGEASYLMVERRGDAMLTPELPLHNDLDSGDAELQEAVVSQLADCDRKFGFEPVFALAPAQQFNDFDCAVAYWLLGAFNSAQQGMALDRARFAIARHLEANPGTQRQPVEQQVMADGQARGQRIQRGQEPADSIQATLGHCEAKYGFAQSVGR